MRLIAWLFGALLLLSLQSINLAAQDSLVSAVVSENPMFRHERIRFNKNETAGEPFRMNIGARPHPDEYFCGWRVVDAETLSNALYEVHSISPEGGAVFSTSVASHGAPGAIHMDFDARYAKRDFFAKEAKIESVVSLCESGGYSMSHAKIVDRPSPQRGSGVPECRSDGHLYCPVPGRLGQFYGCGSCGGR